MDNISEIWTSEEENFKKLVTKPEGREGISIATRMLKEHTPLVQWALKNIHYNF